MEERQWRQTEPQSESDFWQWMESYYPKAMRLACLLCGNRADGEDAVQESFLLMYRHWDQIKTPAAYPAYFTRTLTRQVWKICKKTRREEPTEEETWPVLTEGSPEEQVLARQQASALYQAVLALPIKQRTVIVLYYYQDLSIKEIAKAMGTLEGTVKSRLFSARKQLRKQWEESQEEAKVDEKKRTPQFG